MKSLKAIVLAAGEGTRMKSKKSKVLHKILNQTMLDYVLDAARSCGVSEVCVVVGHKADEVMGAVEGDDISFALQAERKGTGHAVMMADKIMADEQDILVLCGDTPLLQGETLQELVDCHRAEGNDVTVMSALLDDPTGYGRIIRNADGTFQKSVEQKDATDAERQAKEINTGVYLFHSNALKAALKELKNDNVQGEYYLPDCLELILSGGGRVGTRIARDPQEFFGVNSRVQLAEATALLQARINRGHMDNGVTIVDTRNTYISPSVMIGEDTVLLPGCILEGETVIGADCTIGPNCRITDVKMGDGVTMQSTTAVSSEIGNEATIGPYAYIRPNCKIGNKVKVGDFVEVKNSTVGDGTKIPHLSYVGDTDAGAKVNFGCGSIMVNYDGEKKHRTVIEDGVFVGCNVNLVAPVTVRRGAYIAAGSTITKEVPEGVLAVARAKQQVIPGWKEKRIGKK